MSDVDRDLDNDLDNDPDNDPDALDERRTALASVILGGVLVVMGLVVMVQASRVGDSRQVVDAGTMPWVVGVLLFLVGVAMALRAGRDLGQAPPTSDAQDWARLGVMLAALVVFAVVINLLGYVVSATLLFGVTAIVLGAPYRLRSFAYGFCVAALVFLAFDIGIGISLPAGPWGF
jgi:putative tricarboxylic transport membrane protein